jgi:hypothetical protein
VGELGDGAELGRLYKPEFDATDQILSLEAYRRNKIGMKLRSETRLIQSVAV